VNGEKIEVAETRFNGAKLANIAVMILTPGYVIGTITQPYKESVYKALNGFLYQNKVSKEVVIGSRLPSK